MFTMLSQKESAKDESNETYWKMGSFKPAQLRLQFNSADIVDTFTAKVDSLAA